MVDAEDRDNVKGHDQRSDGGEKKRTRLRRGQLTLNRKKYKKIYALYKKLKETAIEVPVLNVCTVQ